MSWPEGTRPVGVETLVPDENGNLHVDLSMGATLPYDLAEGDEVVVFTTQEGILLAPSWLIKPQLPASMSDYASRFDSVSEGGDDGGT